MKCKVCKNDKEVCTCPDFKSMTDEQAEIYGTIVFGKAMLSQMQEKRRTGKDKYKGYHNDDVHGITKEAHNNWLKDWLREKVDEENWVAVGNLSMMLYMRENALD